MWRYKLSHECTFILTNNYVPLSLCSLRVFKYFVFDFFLSLILKTISGVDVTCWKVSGWRIQKKAIIWFHPIPCPWLQFMLTHLYIFYHLTFQELELAGCPSHIWYTLFFNHINRNENLHLENAKWFVPWGSQ